MLATPFLLALLAAADTAAPPPPPPPLPPRPARASRAPAPAAPTVQSHRAGDWPARPSGKSVTLTEHATVDEALERIAEAAGWNLVANTGDAGEEDLVITLRGVPVEDAIEAVLQGTSLVATRRGDVVTVAPGRVASGPVLKGFEGFEGKRFTGGFDDAPVEEAIRRLADLAGFSVVFPPGLRGAVSGHFKDAPVEDVLRAILAQANLAATREGQVVRIERPEGPSLVVEGGKRGLAFRLDGLGPEIQRQVDGALRGVDRGAVRADRDAERAERKAARAGRGGDRVLRGDQVIGAGERVGDLVVLGGDLRLEPGASASEVTVIKGSIDLGEGSTVEYGAVAVGGDVHVGAGARVGGDAVSVGGKVVIDEAGEVQGDTTSVEIPGLTSLLGTAVSRVGGVADRQASAGWRAGRALGEFALFFLLGLLVLVLFPRRVEAVTGALRHAPGKAVLTGVLGTLAIPVVTLLLIATIIGIPFIAVLAFGLAAAWVLGFAGLALFIGRALPFRFERGAPVLHLALGAAILVALGQVPLLGCLAWLAAWLFLFGVVLRTRFGQPPGSPPPVLGTTAPPAPPAAA